MFSCKCTSEVSLLKYTVVRRNVLKGNIMSRKNYMFRVLILIGISFTLFTGCYSPTEEEIDIEYGLDRNLLGRWEFDSLLTDSLWDLEDDYLFYSSGEFNNVSSYSSYTWKTFEDSVLILEYEISSQGGYTTYERHSFRYSFSDNMLILSEYNWFRPNDGHGEIIASGRFQKAKK